MVIILKGVDRLMQNFNRAAKSSFSPAKRWVMMVNPRPEEGELGHLRGADPVGTRIVHWNVLGALAVAGVVLVTLVRSAAESLPVGPEHAADFGELSSISRMIFENPMENPLTVSFELISFLVLVGIIAAINFSRRDPSHKKGTP